MQYLAMQQSVKDMNCSFLRSLIGFGFMVALVTLGSLHHQSASANDVDFTHILVIGDEFSLDEQWQGTKYSQQKSWLKAADERFRGRGITPYWINESKAGGTLQHAASVIDWRLRQKRPHVLLVALGGNDARYGYRPDFMAKNLNTIIDRASQHSTEVVLVYNRMPSSMARISQSAAERELRRVADQAGIELIVLKADETMAKQSVSFDDWPKVTAKNQTHMLDLIWTPLLKAAKSSKGLLDEGQADDNNVAENDDASRGDVGNRLADSERENSVNNSSGITLAIPFE